MIIPLVGLFIACAIFACIGAAVLALIPDLNPTLANVGLFVIGLSPAPSSLLSLTDGSSAMERVSCCNRALSLASLAFCWALDCAEDC